MDRRRFVRTAGLAAATGLAGCGGTDGGQGGGGQSIDEHPAAADLDAQPTLGSTDGHVVLAFEDPACPTCKAFHEGTVPKLKQNLVDAGEGAYVFRTYPVTYPWGEPATKALEATYERDGDAFWSLLDHYFAERDSFSTDNVLDETRSFLAAQTDVDGAAVAEAVRNGEADDAVQADLDAAEEAGLDRTTPTVLLFKDGTYQTTAKGSVSYDLIARTLDL